MFSDSNPMEDRLFSTANKFSKASEAKRDVRYERRKATQAITKLSRLADCGNTAVGQVLIGLSGNQAHFTNLATCGSVWACSVCSAKVLSIRSEEISTAVDVWAKREGQFIFETLTLSHTKHDSLSRVWASVSKAFASTNAGTFSKVHKEFGQVGYMKVVEVTHGINGWHVHLHLLRFISQELTQSEISDWSTSIFNRWADSLVKQGFKSPLAKFHVFELVESPEKIKGYFAKNFDNSNVLPGMDLSSSGVVRGHGMWRVLDVALTNHNSSASRIWAEWERTSRGKRQISWSKNLRKSLGLSNVLSDDEAVNSSDSFVPLVAIDGASVRLLGRLGSIQSRILRAIEQGDLATACQLLNEHGVNWWFTKIGAEAANAQSSTAK
jgi:hypothetical protein